MNRAAAEQNAKVITEATARAKDLCSALIAKLRADGHEVETGTGRLLSFETVQSFETISKVDGEHVWMAIRLQSRGDCGIGVTRYNGRMTMSIGYGKGTTFPEPKAGFDVAKTAERMMERVNDAKASTARRIAAAGQAEITKALSGELNAALGAETWSTMGAEVTHAFGDVYRMKLAVNADEARAMVELLAQMRASRVS